jgi:hypothetical protein
VISWIIVAAAAVFIAWVYVITVRALRHKRDGLWTSCEYGHLAERKRRRPFEDAFDRSPRRFGKRTSPPVYFERIDDAR